MKEIHITFDSKEVEQKLLADEKFVKALTSLITLADNINSRVGAEVMAANNELKMKVEEQCSDCIHNFNEQYPRPIGNNNWCGFLIDAQYPCMKKI